VAGFSAIAERLGAEGTADFLSGYLGKMTDTLLRHGATIDKYLGDGIMAFWGAPIHDPRHARNACRAGAALARAVTEVGLREAGGDGPGPVRIRIGLAAGDVMVGDFGNPPIRSSYTVLGDACNIAARLEGACKLLGATILVSSAVRAAAGEGFIWRPLGKFILEGRLAPEPVFELVGAYGPGGMSGGGEQGIIGGRAGLGPEDVAAWIQATEEAVEAFGAARWDDARERFEALERDYGDTALARVYLDAIRKRASGGPFNEPMDAVQLGEA
jgi:adenylate cyclase